MMILYSLALAGRDDEPFPPFRPVPLSINALATRFSVSRKHVLMLLRDAEALQLLVRDGNAIAFLPRGREVLEMMFANLFSYMAECAEIASRASTPAAANASAAAVAVAVN
jgi:DNA-binding GntR family transcriptional regulator